jgi:hypothetical protein
MSLLALASARLQEEEEEVGEENSATKPSERMELCAVSTWRRQVGTSFIGDVNGDD